MNVSALDENGKAVDWWFAYKVPKLAKSANSPTATGYEYIYYDANVGKVARSPYLLTDGKGALDLTLKSVFDKPDATTGWILYNDEMPTNAKRLDSSSFGHTKGVIGHHHLVGKRDVHPGFPWDELIAAAHLAKVNTES